MPADAAPSDGASGASRATVETVAGRSGPAYVVRTTVNTAGAQWAKGATILAGRGDNAAMDGRISRIETAVEHLQQDVADLKAETREQRRDAKTDFRLLFGAVIFVALGLAGLMAKGFKWL